MCIFCFFLRNILFLQILCFITWGCVADVFNYNSTLNLVLDESNISHHLLDTKGFEQWDSRDAFGLAWCESWAQVTRITGQCHCWGTPEPLIKKQSWHSLRHCVILEHWWRGKGILLNWSCKVKLCCVLLHTCTDHFIFLQQDVSEFTHKLLDWLEDAFQIKAEEER